MAGALMSKVWDLLGMNQAEEDEEEMEEDVYDCDYEEEEEQPPVEEKRGLLRRSSKVVSMPQPTGFEQSEEICGFLKEKKSVIVNLEYVNKEVARRIIDFISGGVYSLDAHIQKVSNSIFLIAPMNYEITNEMAREEIKNKLSVSWLRNNN